MSAVVITDCRILVHTNVTQCTRLTRDLRGRLISGTARGGSRSSLRRTARFDTPVDTNIAILANTALLGNGPRSQERRPQLGDTAGAQGRWCGRLGAPLHIGEQLRAQEVQVAAQSAHAGAEVGELAGEAGDEGGIDGCTHALIVAWMRCPWDE
ncbi:hypothetical protein ACFVVM_17220 [Nocardia sp. NPDC058176]|uniref:hypothetical protein n=1 Tax=Nocardia sp. NPDC058176 TaxID=3346368 RepID=UPI0036DEF393